MGIHTSTYVDECISYIKSLMEEPEGCIYQFQTFNRYGKVYPWTNEPIANGSGVSQQDINGDNELIVPFSYTSAYKGIDTTSSLLVLKRGIGRCGIDAA